MSDSSKASGDPFSVQSEVRATWRSFLDTLAPIRPELFQFCLKLTGNVWDAEDLIQDALLRVFSSLGKTDADLTNPKAYLIRTATNLWIDKIRRSAREKAILELNTVDEAAPTDTAEDAVEATTAAAHLIGMLHPQERAAVVLKDVLDLSLRDSAEILNTTVGAVKSALSRGRARLDHRKEPAGIDLPNRELVEQFMIALRDSDLASLKRICSIDLTVEMVGGAESRSFEESQSFFQHAHFVMPELGFGESPRWALSEYQGELIVLGFRTLDGQEGLNEIHRVETLDKKITRIRCYCFCPDVLRSIGDALDLDALNRPYRSPSPEDYQS